jgi:hypothetical protein
MIDIIDNEISAFIGAAFSDKIIYNIVERDGEFINTGKSIINFLKYNKNKFVGKLIESQSYDSIRILLDDKMVYGNHFSNQNSNIDSFTDVYTLINKTNNWKYFYIYDIFKDLLYIKIPEINHIVALDYKNDMDTKNFINNIKGSL